MEAVVAVDVDVPAEDVGDDEVVDLAVVLLEEHVGCRCRRWSQVVVLHVPLAQYASKVRGGPGLDASPTLSPQCQQ